MPIKSRQSRLRFMGRIYVVVKPDDVIYIDTKHIHCPKCDETKNIAHKGDQTQFGFIHDYVWEFMVCGTCHRHFAVKWVYEGSFCNA